MKKYLLTVLGGSLLVISILFLYSSHAAQAQLPDFCSGVRSYGYFVRASYTEFDERQPVDFCLLASGDPDHALHIGPLENPWQIIDASGTPIFTPSSVPSTEQPAASWSYFANWDQRDDSGKYVKPGTYSVVFGTYPGAPSASFTILKEIAKKPKKNPDIELYGGFYPVEILQGWNFTIMPRLISYYATSSNLYLVLSLRDATTGEVKFSQTTNDLTLTPDAPTSPTQLAMSIEDSSSLTPGIYPYDLAVYHDFIGNPRDAKTFALGTLTISTSVSTTTRTVTGLTPAQGDILTVGRKYDISWTGSNIEGMPVSLLLIGSNPAGEPPIIETIASDLTSISSYSWKVEDTVKPGDYDIRIVVNPGGLSGAVTHSPQFTVVSKTK